MYELILGGKKYEFADEAAAHQFLSTELGFRDKKSYDGFFTGYAKAYSNSELPQKTYSFIASLPAEVTDLLAALRRHEWATANEEARAEWQAKKAKEEEERLRPQRERDAAQLEEIKQDEQGRWLVAHPGSTPEQFAAIWPIRLAQLESEWRTQYEQDRMAQLKAAGGYL